MVKIADSILCAVMADEIWLMKERSGRFVRQLASIRTPEYKAAPQL